MINTPDGTLSNGTESILVTVEGAVALLQIPRTAVFELVRAGQLASIRHGKRRLISRASIDAWAAARLVEAATAAATR